MDQMLRAMEDRTAQDRQVNIFFLPLVRPPMSLQLFFLPSFNVYTYPWGGSTQLLLRPWASLSWLQSGVFSQWPQFFITKPWKGGQESQIAPPIPSLSAMEADSVIQVWGVTSLHWEPDSFLRLVLVPPLILAYVRVHTKSLFYSPVLHYSCQFWLLWLNITS